MLCEKPDLSEERNLQGVALLKYVAHNSVLLRHLQCQQDFWKNCRQVWQGCQSCRQGRQEAEEEEEERILHHLHLQGVEAGAP